MKKTWSMTSAISCAWNYCDEKPADYGGFNIDVKLSWTHAGQGPGFMTHQLKKILSPFDHVVFNEVFAAEDSEPGALSHKRVLDLMWPILSAELAGLELEMEKLELLFDDQTSVSLLSSGGSFANFVFPLRSLLVEAGARHAIDKQITCEYLLEKTQSFLVMQDHFADKVSQIQSRLRKQTLDQALGLSRVQDLARGLFVEFSKDGDPVSKVISMDTFSNQTSCYFGEV